MIEHTWSAQKILESIPWLRRENAVGADIYARPDDNSYILVDDVPSSKLAIIRQHSAAVVETSDKNNQVWVRLPERPTDREASSTAKSIARHYGGDPKSADFKHLGRLPGFTNRKPERTRADGRSPYVLIHDWSGRVTGFGNDLLQSIRVGLAKMDSRRLEAAVRAADDAGKGDPVAEYRKHAKGILAAAEADVAAKKLPGVDWSSIDFRVAQAMARNGYSTAGIAQGIVGGSPQLEERKGRSISAYAERTAQAAMASPEIQKFKVALEVAKKSRNKDKGHDHGYG